MTVQRDPDASAWGVAAARRILGREGCDSGVLGVVSVRVPGRHAVWASRMEHGEVTSPDDVACVDLDATSLPVEVSPALATHLAIYAARSDVGAVVHTHSHSAAVVASTGRPIGMFNEMATMYHETQACFEDPGDHSRATAQAAARALGDARVLLLKGHGVVTAAASLGEAVIDAIAVERSARWHLEATAFGGDEIVPAHVRQTKLLYDAYFRRNMWAANLRRLRRSDPDLFTDDASS